LKKRRESRIKALEVLYQQEMTGQSIGEILDLQKSLNITLDDFTLGLIKGVDKHIEQIDTHIALASARWTLDRMPAIDRNILRIATFEIMYDKNIPVSVSINEAIEIAKEYGTPDSSKFVNGVLGAVAAEIEKKKK
jgi:N utilization substance protein B